MFGKQLFGIVVWVRKTILISFLKRGFFCENDIIVQKFKIITPNTIGKKFINKGINEILPIFFEKQLVLPNAYF